MVRCGRCGKALGAPGSTDRKASISGCLLGDEYIESYLLCPRCGVYMVEVCCDRFLGEESVSIYGPLEKEAGDARVELIRRCATPWDKNCRCEAHREYFGQRLD